MDKIHADQEFNCRGTIAPIDVLDLAKDIKDKGLMQPITVSPYSDEDKKKTGFDYLLIAGYRRYMAFKVNQEKEIPCVIKYGLDNKIDALCLNLSENTQRQELNILQESAAIKKLYDMGLSETEIRNKLQKPRGWVQVRFMLLSLPVEVQNEAAAGMLTQTNVRDLYCLKNKKGVDACFDGVRKIKMAKERGEKAIISPQQKSHESKRHRHRAEIFLMMKHLRERVNVGLHSRCLAWAAGEITTGELFQSIKEHADENGYDYTIPEALE